MTCQGMDVVPAEWVSIAKVEVRGRNEHRAGTEFG